MIETKRKGARSKKDISAEIMAQLNSGQIETANLVEWLAVDQRLLLENLLKQQDRVHYLKPVLTRVDNLKKQTVNTINEAIGAELYRIAEKNDDRSILNFMHTHPADVVRCWATYSIGKNESLSISEVFEQIRPFAADKHFGVREIAWLAIRERLAGHVVESIGLLSEWTSDQDENVRRFASEASRPRGVWCEHIEVLKREPELGLPILEPLSADKSKYVQNSVGNWLNDASKTQPDFVKNLCDKWLDENDSKETKYIVKQALRTINK